MSSSVKKIGKLIYNSDVITIFNEGYGIKIFKTKDSYIRTLIHMKYFCHAVRHVM